MQFETRLLIDRPTIAAFCRRHGIRRLSVFGSVLRDDFGPESDVDVLVELEPGALPGLSFFGAGEEFARLVGRRVDFLLPSELSRYYRDEVLREAVPLYVSP